MNFLEELVSEWYEHRGYFVRRNVRVGPRSMGGYDCELDVVALHPGDGKLVHVEASMDASSWAVRENRFAKKFEAGARHIPDLFSGIELPDEVERIALLGYGSRKTRSHVGGGRIMLVDDILSEILFDLRDKRVATAAVPEDKPLLRMLQYVAEHRGVVMAALHGDVRGS